MRLFAVATILAMALHAGAPIGAQRPAPVNPHATPAARALLRFL